MERMARRGKNLEKLIAIGRLIAAGVALPANAKPHKLSGEYANLWECHIEPDWLLIYNVNNEEVLLARTGSHADLFE